MQITYANNNMYIRGIDHFSLTQTLLCGQAFRWKQDGERLFGVALSKPVSAVQSGRDVTIYGARQSDGFEQYFDLQRDYGAIKQNYSADEYLCAGMEFAGGVRVMRQPPFETLISFIISANNNVKRIIGIVDKLCARYGEPIGEGLFDFPTQQALSNATEQDVAACGAGYRARYIIETARSVSSGFDLLALRQLPFLQARQKLTALMGVGMKVADCVCLYSLGFACAFPNDVWMNRVLCGAYGYSGTTDKQMRSFVDEKFGENAGIAQQYLFHYARNHPELICKVSK
jgi:N-glycosylase/DNA lyase